MSKDEYQTLTASQEYVTKYNIEAFIRAAEEYKTAGIRGTIGKTLEEGLINIGSVRLYAQARSKYIKNHYPAERQAIFIGRDERLFSHELAMELARVYAANGVKVYFGEQSTPCPITSYTGWFFGIPADLVSASHNTATMAVYYNGIKPSSDSGGLISEDETNIIIDNMKNICLTKGSIRLVPFNHKLIEIIDPLPIYIQHLKNNLNKEDVEIIRQAGEKGLVKSYWATYGGAAGPALERINKELLCGNWESYIYKLHWEPDPYFHNYGEKPDPSDPAALKDMLIKEEIWKRITEGDISFVQATDGDGDRIGLFCGCPHKLILHAQQAGMTIYNSKGKSYESEDFIRERPAVVYISPYQLFVILTFMRLKKLQALGKDLSSHVIITSHSTPYFEKIAKVFGCKLVYVPTGFRWLNLAAQQIEYGSEYVELEEVHWRGEMAKVRQHIGRDQSIVVICEESGGINLGNIREEENKIGRKSKIAKEKDGLKTFFFIQLEVSALALAGRTMVDLYLEILSEPGLGNTHFNRLDIALASGSGVSMKKVMMDFYTELCEKYSNCPCNLHIGGMKAKKIFKAGDGVKIFFENGSWLHIRPSGTEPKLKIFTWGNTSEEQKKLEAAVLMQKEELYV